MYTATSSQQGFDITVSPNSGQGDNAAPTFNVSAANSLRAKVGCSLTTKCQKNINITVRAKNHLNPAVEMSLNLTLETDDQLAYLKD